MALSNESNLRRNIAGQFATTHWSLVLAAGNREHEQSHHALEALCRAYWPPLYAYVRRRVSDVHEARDLTQAFFARLLEKHYVADADPNRGRFRAFLITAFKHFLSNEWEKARAIKRGGGRRVLSLDFDSADSQVRIDPASRLTAEQQYDRQWAITLLERIMDLLETEFTRKGKANHFEALKGFIVGDHAGTTYSQVANRLGMTEAAAKKAGSRLRRRYRELLREEIAQTVSGPDEVEDELRNLFAALE
ncbi:MAG: sigma-70 family RNA polymerase sigma factor [Planctomycetota bacterium]|nr:MAG: sigma-70 family RNA polymerase sigma factor [Planctomycetota bacterium]REK25844.1 MAG: sigma-70 family RNA polymerase sigma factor [Planctomycetota bacterium]REK37123.1 MAG: sigma-70 family RNA polymerase sigma factor [Planctomycetota bacterium]